MRWPRPLRRPEVRAGYVFMAPAFLLMMVFAYLPMVGTVYLSFTDYNPLGAAIRFQGLDNYIELMDSQLFWISVRNTVVYTVVYVPTVVAVGFLTALLLNRGFRGIGFVRGVYYLPVLTSSIAVGMVWMWLVAPFGVINLAAEAIGLTAHDYLGDPSTALGMIALISIWRGFGGMMVIYLAGLQGIPKEIEEAARIDGCSDLALLTQVTWPLLRPITFYLVVVGVIGAMQVFDLVNVLSGPYGAAPSEAVTTVVHQIYMNAFPYGRGGFASAQATILFVFIAALTIFNFRSIKWEFQY